MMYERLLLTAMGAGLLLLAGCSDPLVGKWKTRDAVECEGKGRLEFDDDYVGEAEIPVACGVYCQAEVTAEEAELGYDFEVEILTPELCLIDGNPPLVKATYDCKWESDETRLDCGNFYEWVRDD